jgi:transcription elongation factor Elf1
MADAPSNWKAATDALLASLVCRFCGAKNLAQASPYLEMDKHGICTCAICGKSFRCDTK